MNPQVLYEDRWLLALCKPIGLDAQTQIPSGTFLVHRLDTPVSGVWVLAKTAQAQDALSKLFQSDGMRKIYWAVTANELPAAEGELIHYLAHAQKGNKTTAYLEPGKDRQKAVLRYRRMGRGERYSIYEVELLTGRTHQIRAQLAAAGAPIKGDLKYGAKRSNPQGGIQLLARSISFLHPFTQEKIELIAEPPEDDALWKALAAHG